MKKPLLIAFYMLLVSSSLLAQKAYFKKFDFTKADTLRGMLSPERTCFDVTFYELNVAIDISKKFIKGYVDVSFEALEDFKVMQLDLYKNMKISQVSIYGLPLTYHRLYNAVFIHFPDYIKRGNNATIRVYYEGFPQVSNNAPWEGGFVWKKDEQVRPWVAVACEGDGASLWWPCKDHLSDEPDSMAINVAVPNGLTCVANGNLRGKEPLAEGYTMWKWLVSYPINNYDVSVNIGHYAHFSDTYVAADGDSLALDYYVLDYNLEKAKIHFQQVKPMLACYENYFGKYPFWNDGYALVETPYLGMEHQSAIAYGNGYMRGYRGGMIPRDMDWDYLIVHESGHEYFGNAVSAKDHADMWIHESFTTYMEALYVECRYGYEDALRYLESQRGFIRNFEPIVGPRNVNWKNWSGSDHYFKGSWLLHTFRNVVDDDEKWFGFLRSYFDGFKYKTTSTEEFLAYLNKYFKKDYSKIFRQYLYHPGLPRFAYKLEQKGNDLLVKYTWLANVEKFDMPIKIGTKGSYQMVFPVAGEEKETLLKNTQKSDFQIATELFYVKKANL
ncbi:MAG TPA: M1 family peptidase [Bacteroidetes bacterium]|nr:M1 family peptidase [Bacteroidota bacterium]